MEDNRKFATFFADAPKGKKIGAVLSWIGNGDFACGTFCAGISAEIPDKNGKRGPLRISLQP